MRSWSCPRRSIRAARAHGPALNENDTSKMRAERAVRRRRRRAARAADVASSAPRPSAPIRRCLRGRPGAPRLSANTSAVGPDAMSVPKSSTNTRRHEAAHELDVVLDEQDRDAPLLLRPSRSLPAELSVSCRSRPDDGSSSSTSFGSVINARPISTRRPTPRLSASTGRSATAPQPEQLEHRVDARVLVGRRPSEEQHVLPERAAARCRTRSATRKCSRGVIPLNSSMRWNVRPMPRRARRCVGDAGEVATVEASPFRRRASASRAGS